MENDIAIFLDSDNLVIGATEAKIPFDINLVLDYIREMTQGRIVLRRAYGDWRQREYLTKSLAAAGFELQSTVRLNNVSKNLADMQLVVDAMGTLVDGRQFKTYVLLTGDRDFMPLVQALRTRGKQVIGMGVRHTSSNGLVNLCDHYIYYEKLVQETYDLLDEQIEDYLQRALDQLLIENKRVPASLLKQRLQALSKGAFGRSRQGNQNFSKLLRDYPKIVALDQEGTTLYVSRPTAATNGRQSVHDTGQRLSEPEVQQLLKESLSTLLQEHTQVRASLLKQTMQERSQQRFDEQLQGDKSFRHFLERHDDLVQLYQEGSTVYVTRPATSAAAGEAAAPGKNGRLLEDDQITDLLQQALDELLVDQSRVRASLLKQRMQDLSQGAFDEAHQGNSSFRQFLKAYPNLVRVEQRGTTLLVQRPPDLVQAEQLHLQYRAELKKRGLRVVPSEIRLLVLKDLIHHLQNNERPRWRRVVDDLAQEYRQREDLEVSKSYVNDVLRIARRAEVINVDNGNKLAAAAVSLQLTGNRLFQDAVMCCDTTYLQEIESLELPFDLDEVSLALYESIGQARYLKVLQHRRSPAAPQ